MIRHLGSALTDITYVFDEPTVGLHPHDVARMNGLLLQLRDKGNTVLVVEHKPEVMAIADHVVDLGPGAGHDGGTVTFEGPYAALRGSGTVTGRYLDQRIGLRPSARARTGVLEVRGASTHNLRDVDVDVPTGVLTVVTGVAGSGKSSLVHGSLAGRDGVLVVDQSAIRGSRRSNPATYTGLLDPIRTAFARANGVSASLFSANSEGACPTCNGQGVVYTDLGMMAGVATRCEACGGRRFRPDVLEHRLHGLTIDEVLRLSMAEAADVFTTGTPRRILTRLLDVGLPYLTLGQPLTTLSGGERQRLKLAASLGDASTYVLDEPTSGLHLADTENLVGMLHGLVDRGNTVVVIEHNLAVIAQADWIVDIGPGAGHDGGTVVFEGTPHDMVAGSDTLTAQHLRRWVSPPS
jgi:excinuclease UvrABC ATPase subunit